MSPERRLINQIWYYEAKQNHQSSSQNSILLSSHLCFSNHPNLQVANQEAKVATQRNGATFTEIIAIGAFGSFVFFQLLRTVSDFRFSEEEPIFKENKWRKVRDSNPR